MKGITTGEAIESASPARRGLIAQRWGLGTAVLPLMVELLRTPRVAHRAYRRLNELGVYTLLRLLVEQVGVPIAAVPALESEAEELRRWQLFVERDGFWSLPADLALALYRPAVDRERLYAGSLLSRVPAEDLLLLLDELGLDHEGSDVSRRWRITQSIAEQPGGVIQDVEAMARSAEAQSLAADELASVRVVPGTRGGVFALTLHNGRELRLAPREVAENAGYLFAAPEFGEDVQLQPAEDTLRIRIPNFAEAGALIRFSTARAADDALQCAEVAALLGRRLTSTLVVTRAGVPLEQAFDTLAAFGFSLEQGRSAPRFERRVNHASE